MKFKHYRQLDSMDCGPTCIRMIAAYYGKEYDLPQLREAAHIQKTGINLLGVSEAAEKIGFRTTAVRCTIETLASKAALPCIIHWKQEHFVVLYEVKIKKKKRIFRVADPAYGLIDYPDEEFKQCWISSKKDDVEKGVAMMLYTTPEFYEEEPIKYEKLSLTFLLKYLNPYRKFIFQLLLGFLAGSLIQLILPFLTQSIVDQGVSKNNLNIIQLILFAQLVLIFSRSVIEMLRRSILLHISTRVNIALVSDFLVKLMKLPMRYFDSKLAADLIRRIADHKNVEFFLTNSIINILFSMVTLMIFGIVLLIYDIKIFSVFAIGTILYILWIKIFMKRRADLNHRNFQLSTIDQDNVLQIVYGMQEIKLCGIEEQKRWEWESSQAGLFRLNLKTLNLDQWQEVGGALINEIKNIVITILAAKSVMSNSITLGAMLSIQYIIGQMHGPIIQLVQFIQQAQNANISMERMGEVHTVENEENKTDRFYEATAKSKLISIKDLSFSYGTSRSRSVLKNLNLDIPIGKTTAIVGLSGSGKTTILKLLLGFYPVNSGEILIGDIPLSEMNLKHWRKHCGVVMQEGYIFNDTVANNIATINTSEQVDVKRLTYAVEMANLKDYVSNLPLKYNTKIGANGSGMSQGQKQRILIARAIYKDPEFIFFDEATNALDSNNEKTILENLDVFFKGRTVIVVAHRLSTIINADNIVVLKNGEIIEQGRHGELISAKSAYYELVKNQLNVIRE